MRVLEQRHRASAAASSPRPAGKLKVLLVADSLDAGGAERHVVGLAASLVRRGHSVTIGCSTGGVLVEVARQHGADVRPLLSSRVKRELSLPFARKLGVLIGCEHFDLVHAHMYASAGAAAVATLGSSVPLVVTEHSEARWRDTRARLLSRFIYFRAQHVIAVSEGIRQRLLCEDGVASNRVTVILNGLPDLDEPDEAAGLQQPLLRVNRRLVGVAARLQPEKGVRYLLEAAVSVAADVPNTTFVIIGDGPERLDLEALAARLGVADRCFFLGFRSDARKIISRLDVLAVPSLSEGTPLVVLEAMAAGVPIVASAVGGIPEQVRTGSEALLVPPADAAALAAGLKHVLLNPHDAQRLAENGRRRVAASFSPEAMLHETGLIYRRLVHTPGPV